MSASYALTDNLTLIGEVINLTGEDQTQRGRYRDQFLYENTQDPRFTVGVRGSF